MSGYDKLDLTAKKKEMKKLISNMNEREALLVKTFIDGMMASKVSTSK